MHMPCYLHDMLHRCSHLQPATPSVKTPTAYKACAQVHAATVWQTHLGAYHQAKGDALVCKSSDQSSFSCSCLVLYFSCKVHLPSCTLVHK